MPALCRQLGCAALRVTLGVVFCAFGTGKIVQGVGAFARGLEQDFASTWLPVAAVRAFGLLLPFLEIVLGTLLVAGPATGWAAAGAAFLVAALTFGLAVSGEAGGVAHNLIYLLALLLLLSRLEDDRWSIDRLLQRSAQAPR